MRKFLSVMAFAACSVTVLSAALTAELFDHSTYNAILQRRVNDKGEVDYEELRQNDASALEGYLEQLADADLAGWSLKERTAFWINAYNAHLMNLILNRPKLKKISDDWELFNIDFKVAGRRLSLNDISHRILFDQINPDDQKGPIERVSLEKPDPRVHFALSNGAMGAPRLRAFAYTAENVEDTLQMDAVAFANAPKNVDEVDGHLRLSMIFKWYRKDFKALGGVPDYLAGLLDSEKRGDAETLKQLLAKDYQKAEFYYDWTLNDVRSDPINRSEPP